MDDTIVISASWLTLLAGALIPFLTGLVTKKIASSAVKSVCTAVLSTVAGIVSAAQQNDGHVEMESALVNILIAFVTAISLYYGLYRPTTAADKVQNIAPTVGVG